MAETITTRIELISIKTLIEGLEKGHIVPDRNLYELGRGIHQDDRQDFIVSMMAGIPVLPFVFDGTYRPWRVLDGEKRLALIWAFSAGNFPIEDSPYLFVGGKRYFEELPLFKRRRFLSTKIPCYVINPPTNPNAINDIKKRMNKPL